MKNWQDDVTLEPEYKSNVGGQHVGVTPTGVWATHSSGLKAFCKT